MHDLFFCESNAWSYMVTIWRSLFQRRSYLSIKGVVLLVCYYYLLFFRMFFLQICELPEKNCSPGGTRFVSLIASPCRFYFVG